MTILRTSLVLGATLLAGAPLGAQAIGTGMQSSGRSSANVSLSAATFLEIPVGARETALGGAATASVSGLASFFWNTAAASDVSKVSAMLSYADLYGGSGLSMYSAALAFPVGGSVVGLSLNQFSSGDIIRTTERFPEGGDPAGGGTVRWAGFAGGVHLARRLTDRLAVGGAVKYVTEGANIASASWIAGDVSTQFRTGLLGTTLGASVQNLSGPARFGGREIERSISEGRDAFPVSRDVAVELHREEATLPVVVQFAVATDIMGGADALMQRTGPHGLSANLAVTDADDRAIQPIAGLEYRFRDLFFARAGKRFRTPDDGPSSMKYGLSGGFGVGLPFMERRVNFDYAAAYLTTTDLPLTHMLTFHFGN